MKRYSVKECFYTVQGEGANAGTPAVFVRFAGCNLWTGRGSDRAAAPCRFCDTDFVGTNGIGGGVYAEDELVQVVRERYRPGGKGGLLVLTGGEPALQLDEALVAAFQAAAFRVAVETNGTVGLPTNLDWVCVSPKAGTNLVVRSGDEIKVVWPQDGLHLDELAALDFTHRFLSPMWTPQDSDRKANQLRALVTVLEDPRWRLTTQLHKHLGIQ